MSCPQRLGGALEMVYVVWSLFMAVKGCLSSFFQCDNKLAGIIPTVVHVINTFVR